jgi:nucleoside-diphosphate-sugar epimerase
MRVFIAGATGVIGRRLVPMLVQDGHEVTGITRSPERIEQLQAQGAEGVVANAYDADGLRAAVEAARPDAVIHELTDIPPALNPRKYATQLSGNNRLRREGTRNLLAAAHAADVGRIVAQSIAFAYAPTGDWVKDEDAPLHLDAPAPMDDALGAVGDLERQVLDAGGLVLRYGYFYGPATSFAPDGAYAQMTRKRQFPIVGSGEARWSFIHVDDAARATVAALHRGAPGIYNIVDDEPASVREWVPAYAQAIGAKRPLKVPLWVGRLAAGPVVVATMSTQRGASNAKARRELEWAPEHPSWRDGFRTAAG